MPRAFVTLRVKQPGDKRAVIDPKTIEQVIAGMQSALPGGIARIWKKICAPP